MSISSDSFAGPRGTQVDIQTGVAFPDSIPLAEINDSILHVYVPGFGEPFPLNMMVARSLANHLSVPVGTYHHSVGEHLQDPLNDVPNVYWSGLQDALERLQGTVTNAETLEGTGHSIAGIALAHSLEQEPGRFTRLELVKAVGTDGPGKNVSPEAVRLSEQTGNLSDRELRQNGNLLLRKYAGLSQAGDNMAHLITDFGASWPIGVDATLNFAKTMRSGGIRSISRAFAIPATLDMRHVINEAYPDTLVGVLAGQRDRVVNGPAIIETIESGSSAVRLDITNSSHVPITSKKGAVDLELAADSMLWMRDHDPNPAADTQVFDHV